jgi:hypothetical protein
MRQLTSRGLAVQFGVTIAQGAVGDQIKTDKGIVEGATASSGIRIFKGIPFAAPSCATPGSGRYIMPFLTFFQKVS